VTAPLVASGTPVRLLVDVLPRSSEGATGRVEAYNAGTGHYRVRLDRPQNYIMPTVLVERAEFEVLP